ncbi:cytochrome P450 [Pseudonocardia ailaonensis]|uniref:cytochrome P450 n=1 Tax=Pseudonocardia ailaonensis TaxID=367279 RepID=UPI0031CE16E8
MTVALAPPSPRDFDPTADISRMAFWRQSHLEREKVFARLRRESPVSWQRPVEWPLPQPFSGFWALTRHADITRVSTDNETFRSAESVVLEPIPSDIARISAFFMAMDAPEHTRLRKIISSAFSPRQIRKITSSITDNAHEIVRVFAKKGEVDVVEDLSRHLPERTFFELVGIPESDREYLGRVIRTFTAEPGRADSDEDPIQRLLRVNGELREYGAELAARKRREPGDDVITTLATTETDGQRLSDDQMGAAMVLLAVAGNDTTRQTTSHAVKALAEHPEQRDWLREDLPGRINVAVEEMIRWASPIVQFARVAAHDAEVGGQLVRAGEKVVMIYSSGNRDEHAFDDPHRFDVGRSPNTHVGFGGGGVHHCLGSPVARAQLRALFTELLTVAPVIEVGEPVYTQNTLVNGITSLPARVVGGG